MTSLGTQHPLVKAAATLSAKVSALSFQEPVHTIYNPLAYAWLSHEAYLRRFGSGTKRVVFLGMNPGPWGMAQTGVPFGEVTLVRDWMGIEETVGKPGQEHPKRPIEGFACEKSEVSGRRLWGLFSERFGAASQFFREHFVGNYCPLVFMGETGRNITPDKLPMVEREPLEAACNEHLVSLIRALQPKWVIGVGKFAESKAKEALAGEEGFRIATVLHPSPASPLANRGWAEQAEKQLKALGVWE